MTTSLAGRKLATRLRAISAGVCIFALVGLVGSCMMSCGTARAQDDDVYEDEITRKPPGDPVIGVKIWEDSWKFVVAKRERGEVPIPAYEVTEVVYADTTRQFASGVKRVARRYYTKAINDSFLPTMEKLDRFRKVAGKPWPLQYCLYYLGHCHLRRGKAGDAARAKAYFERLVKEIPDSRFIFQALLELGETYASQRDFKEAGVAYEDARKRFDSMARDTDIPQKHMKQVRRYALSAQLRSIQMLDAQKEYDRAISAYTRLVDKARDYPGIRARAMVGVVRALVSTEQYDRAIERASEMIDEAEREGNTEYLGGAYLALADCYFERSREEEATPEDLVTARWNYMRVATLYFFERKLLPKARFRAGRCFEKLVAQRGEGKKAKEQAVRQYRLVKKEFPESPWAAEAAKALLQVK